MNVPKLGLGTVQFGMNYGAFNQTGRTIPTEVYDILKYCDNNGIRTLDTAHSYGDSESVLGQFLEYYDFQVITKTPHFRKPCIDLEDGVSLRDSFTETLERLKQSAVYGLMIHHADDLLTESGDILYQELQKLKSAGRVRKIGVSVYTQVQIENIVRNYEIDIVQVPINVFDQRLVQGGVLRELKKSNIEIHARSAFLQGLLLANPERLQAHFKSHLAQIKSYHRFLEEIRLSPIEAALGFLKGISEIDCIVVGVENLLHLKEIHQSYHRTVPLVEGMHRFALSDERIINPSLWKL